MNYFKTDGIRGVYPKEINEDMLCKVGKAISMLGYNYIIIGYDNRGSSPSLANAIALGARASNINVYIMGYTTTPKLEYYSKMKCSIGVMITASHNDASYNGVKIFIEGKKASKEIEELISEEIDSKDLYIDYLLKYNPITNKKIVLDCANGPTSITCSKVYPTAILCNGNLSDEINLKCGSTYISNIINLVKENNADLGFSFDGDGDRVIAVSKEGEIIDGDYLCYILAKYYRKIGKFNNKVVLTRMTNKGVINAFEKEGIQVYLCDVGDKNVYKAMVDNDVMLGSEASGHIINLSLDIIGDAVLNSMIIVEALESLGLTLDDIFNEIKMVPSILKNYYIEDMNIDLSGFADVDILVRKSGTEKCYRVYLQCEDESRLKECIELIDKKMRI